ncbi:hypothetical protein P12x_006116 (plasmid) [Tundrisphaera lichenicola]|uniref:hypothetical protein n=1 Tax=Tundrisphaera lichenicola TaxID=2029860 RepID=UPI003EB85F95
MDHRECLCVLISRCVVLIGYHHQRAPAGAGRAEMMFELGWLAADARRWGLRPEVVAAGVLAELGQEYGCPIASALILDMEEVFGLVGAMA